jgi:ornithine cyclodeaminase/alanine dehydrogenase-like protein (mu-crystallin family)
MLILSEKEIQSLIDIEELIEALEQAHIQYSTGNAVMPVRLVVPLPQIQGASPACRAICPRIKLWA